MFTPSVHAYAYMLPAMLLYVTSNTFGNGGNRNENWKLVSAFNHCRLQPNIDIKALGIL